MTLPKNCSLRGDEEDGTPLDEALDALSAVVEVVSEEYTLSDEEIMGLLVAELVTRARARGASSEEVAGAIFNGYDFLDEMEESDV